MVPLLSALASTEGRTHVVNVFGPDDLVIETKASISLNQVLAIKGPVPSAAVQSWVSRFAAHEQAFLEASLTMSEDAIRRTLLLDPLVSHALVEPLTCALRGGPIYS